jgi:beta-lactamase superfamily II metal-dependent hydrolase
MKWNPILLLLVLLVSCGGGDAGQGDPLQPLDFQHWGDTLGDSGADGLDQKGTSDGDAPGAPDLEDLASLDTGDATGTDTTGDALGTDTLPDTLADTSIDLLPVPEGFQIIFLDVGQGDSILLRFPEGSTMLVDGGGDGAGKWVVAPYLAAAGIDHLDIMVATHAHSDHIGGLDELIERVTVGRIWETGAEAETWDWYNFSEAADAADIKRLVVTRGYKTTLDGCAIKVLNSYEGWDNPNADSIVLRVDCEGKSLLLTGDVTSGAMLDMMDFVNADLDTDVAKIAHHGSPDSFEEFPAEVSAAVAVCSVGEGNPYNHPDSEVVAEWEATGAQVYRTDLRGKVVVTVNDGALVVEFPDED